MTASSTATSINAYGIIWQWKKTTLDAEIQGVISDNPIEKLKVKEKQIAGILPFQWKKGQSGNPAGRPKGKTMKDYARDAGVYDG